MEENEINQNNLTGMKVAEAKEYILGFITTLQLTKKEIISLESEAAKWKNRAELARSKGMDTLVSEAEKEAARTDQKLAALREEESQLTNQIDQMRRQIPALAAGERSIDPLLLEQELLMALGKTGEEAEADKAFRELEKNSAAESALDALKAKMKRDSQ